MQSEPISRNPPGGTEKALQRQQDSASIDLHYYGARAKRFLNGLEVG